MIEALKVSSKSNPNSVAGALAGVVRGSGSVEIQVVGAGALNQAIKAVAIARGYLASSGVDLTCRPTFADIEIDGESRTAIRLQVEACEPQRSSPLSQPAAAGDAGPAAAGDAGPAAAGDAGPAAAGDAGPAPAGSSNPAPG